MDCSTSGFPVPHNLWMKFMSMALVMPSSHLIPWCPLLLLPSIFPRIRTFSMSQLFATSDQNTGASASASVLPLSIQGWFPLRLTGLVSVLFKGLLHSLKVSILGILASLQSSSHNRMWPREDHSLDYTDFVSRVMSLLFNTLYRFVITFLLRSKCFLISWLQWPPAVISEPKKRNSVSTSTLSPSICHAVMGSDAMILVFFNILIFLYMIEKLIFFIYDL